MFFLFFFVFCLWKIAAILFSKRHFHLRKMCISLLNFLLILFLKSKYVEEHPKNIPDENGK